MIDKLPLCIIILCHRQDQRIVTALASAQSAEEVLVIDYQSQNNWSELARQFNFKVIAHDQPLTDFATARNEAVKLATTDWVFFLDSDEEITHESWADIQTLLTQTEYQGIAVRRVDYFLGQPMQWGEVGRVFKLRLAKKEFLRFQRPVHEVAQVNGKTTTSDIVINHYPHQDIDEFMSKIALYATMEASYRPSQPQWQSVVEFIFFPVGKFILNYLIKLGCLDGWRGFLYALIMSLHSAAVRVALYEKK